jgi:hypothetical protein
MMHELVQFGVAGLMGVLWVWERMHSRRREEQLSQTHQRLLEQDRQLSVFTEMVRQNTRAIVEFERVQRRMCEILQEISHEMQRTVRTA